MCIRDRSGTANLYEEQLWIIADDLTKAFSEGAQTSLRERTINNQKMLKKRDPVVPNVVLEFSSIKR